jgi:hypothetical protein
MRKLKAVGSRALPAPLVALCLLVSLPAAAPAAETPNWIARSNENAKILLEVQARISPEGAARLGVEGFDREIMDLKAGFSERNLKLIEEAIAKLKARLNDEREPRVRQDLEIMIQSAELVARDQALSDKLLLPYFDAGRMVFMGLRGLLDDRVSATRRPAALVRLKRYAGMESGYEPLAKLAEARTRERLRESGLAGPFRGEVEKSLAEAGFLIDGIAPLFEKHGIAGCQEPLAKLKEQLGAYHDFVRKEILPRTRSDFRMPPELYALALEQYGVDIPPADLAQRARGAFLAIQVEMQEIAGRLAKERGWASGDYRDVIRELKKEQLAGEAILTHYKERLKQIEEIVRRENLVTLPQRPARIRLATPAESAMSPAPNMSPPRLVGNTGEQGDFVLPLNVPGADGAMQSFDDFTFAAASWTLTVHEARPGHEMQFAAMVEGGVSTARAVYAFNSTNVEGWGLYSEAVMKPYMPLEGQLISLQHRLMRAARAFLDPELQMGKISADEARRVLREDGVLSEAMANQEVERYTFRAPGQATSYFYGYTKLMELRNDAQKALGAKFDPKKFHDFILSQGLLPPALLRKAVMEQLVGGGA